MSESDENQNQGGTPPTAPAAPVVGPDGLPPAHQMPLSMPLDKIASWYSNRIKQDEGGEEAGEEGGTDDEGEDSGTA